MPRRAHPFLVGGHARTVSLHHVTLVTHYVQPSLLLCMETTNLFELLSDPFFLLLLLDKRKSFLKRFLRKTELTIISLCPRKRYVSLMCGVHDMYERKVKICAFKKDRHNEPRYNVITKQKISGTFFFCSSLKSLKSGNRVQ